MSEQSHVKFFSSEFKKWSQKNTYKGCFYFTLENPFIFLRRFGIFRKMHVQLFTTKFMMVISPEAKLSRDSRCVLPWWLRMVAPCDKSPFWCKRQAWLDTSERPPYKAVCPLSPLHPLWATRLLAGTIGVSQTWASRHGSSLV